MYNLRKKCLYIYNMYREALLYLVFGGLTTLISIAVYGLLTEGLNVNILAANVVSWVAAVAFAYITNRRFVFASDASGGAQRIKEMLSFYAGRIATLVLEEAILLIFIDCLHFKNMPVKIAAQLFVIAANYIISKLFVFRKRKNIKK